MTFEMNSAEIQEANTWIKEHNKTCILIKENTYAAIGGAITFTFTPTSLGMACGVMCACGESHECTDVSNW